MNALKRVDNNVIIISLLTPLTFIILFLFRALDDNRLTSWQWVLTNVNITKIFLILLAGLIPAYIFSRFSFPKRYPAICLFFLSYAVATLFWGEPEVIVDASRYFTQAKHLGVYGVGYFFREWGKDINVWTDMPLLPFIYGLIFKFFGELRLYIQIFTTSLFSMTVALTYLIGKELWDEDTGLYAGLLLLGIPYLLTQVPLMLVDVPTMFFLMLSVFTFIKALNHGGIWIGLSSLAIFLTFFSKYSTWLMLSVLIIIFLVYLKMALVKGGEGGLRRQGKTVFYRGSITILIAGILIGVALLYKLDVFSEQIKLLINYQLPGLRRWGESFISTFFFQIHPFITATTVYSVYAAFKKRDLKYLIIIWLIFLVVAFQIKRIRYIMMAFPMLTLMASYGLQGIRDRRIVRFISLCIVVFSVIIAVFAYLPFLSNTTSANIKNAGVFLNSLDTPDIEVFTIQAENPDVNYAVSVPILDLFTEKRIRYYYDASSALPLSEVEKSPLRFTWEYKNPDYYSKINKREDSAVVVLISDDKTLKLPAYVESRIKDSRRVKKFAVSDEIFRFQVFVSVYSR